MLRSRIFKTYITSSHAFFLPLYCSIYPFPSDHHRSLAVTFKFSRVRHYANISAHQLLPNIHTKISSSFSQNSGKYSFGVYLS
ncbi:hypothetical protein E2C01_074549 [Portunus trituberculatus]|uniref:Uncharacterized protein n=1 Tax=Portunus trituberculatus TaxID=210409 RepID=A0A5B7IDS7_PORTR|nr:hypothetical protein [Portunus trituberculatus]